MEKLPFIVLIIIIAAILAVGINYILYLHNAHNSFENYYAFRGCVKLISKTDRYGICQLKDGKTIKLVNIQGRWYLDGDLPICFGVCF